MALDRRLVAALLLAAGCSRETPGEPWRCRGCNLVVVSLTNTRAQNLELYGYGRATMPNLSLFFAKAFAFESAFSPASWTLPAAASLFASRYPFEHGVTARFEGQRLDDGAVTMAEALAAQGYRTAAFTGGGDYDRRFNLGQGFSTYIDQNNYAEHGIGLAAHSEHPLLYGDIGPLVAPAVTWLRAQGSHRFFLFVQGFDPHCPFQPRPPFAERYDPDYTGSVDFSRCLWTFEATQPVVVAGERRWPVKTHYGPHGFDHVNLSDRDVAHLKALYDGELTQADWDLTPLWSALEQSGLLARTVVVFISEHGDALGEHGRFMRGGPLRGTFYDPVLRFPLLVRHPKGRGLTAVETLAETVDLLPTLLDLLGVRDPIAGERRGVSLLPALAQPQRQLRSHAYAGSLYRACDNVFFAGTSVVEAIRDTHFKLIREESFDAQSGQRSYIGYELYDLRRDAGELRNVYFEQRDHADRLERTLRARYPALPVGPVAAPCQVALP